MYLDMGGPFIFIGIIGIMDVFWLIIKYRDEFNRNMNRQLIILCFDIIIIITAYLGFRITVKNKASKKVGLCLLIILTVTSLTICLQVLFNTFHWYNAHVYIICIIIGIFGIWYFQE